jgi:hypothetical protein
VALAATSPAPHQGGLTSSRYCSEIGTVGPAVTSAPSARTGWSAGLELSTRVDTQSAKPEMRVMCQLVAYWYSSKHAS